MTASDLMAATTGRRIAYHSLLNLVGTASPLLVAVVAIPLLIGGLGTERFGILTLVWVAVGYLSLLDLGIGRALTKLVAERVGTDDEAEVAPLIGTALLLMLGVGVLGAAAVAALAPWLVRSVLSVPPALVAETLPAFLLVAVCLPLVTLTSALRGVLEAYHRFDLVNAVRVPMGIFTFLGPLLVLPFSTSLLPIVAVLLLGRVVAVAVHAWLVTRCVESPRGILRLDLRSAGPLLRFGGWMTVSNVVSPLMVSLDRFLIGALISVAAVAYYATPYEIVTKLWLIPGALLSVLFPAFAAGGRPEAQEQTVSLFGRALLLILAVIGPVTLVIVAFGEAGLTLWVGEEFARNSTVVLQWLAIGVLINCVAQVPFTLLQGLGRPDLPAKLHLCELPLYLGVLWWLTGSYGIAGAAAAWVLRVAVDTALLLHLSSSLLPAAAPWVRRAAGALGATLLVVVAGILLPNDGAKLGFVAAVIVLAAAAAWSLWKRQAALVSAPIEPGLAKGGG